MGARISTCLEPLCDASPRSTGMGQTLWTESSSPQSGSEPRWPCLGRLSPGYASETVTVNTGTKIVMGKYLMYANDCGITGEGTSSICRKGQVIGTKQPVAIKVYKVEGQGPDKITYKKFRRQVEVLKQLMGPLKPPEDPTLWCERLSHTDSSRLFMQLIDYSRDASGEPGPDPTDGVMYVVTELGSYSLKEYIRSRKLRKNHLSKETVWDIVKATLLVVAGLHAKGLVHLDLKPENLMFFNGALKLIDVDGCIPKDTVVSIDDSSLSFSPCYCAPEWANFLIDDVDDPVLKVSPHLDVWSIGMTLCELVTLEPIFRATYASFMRNGRSQQQGGFYFMDWLSNLKKVELPDQIRQHDERLADLLENHLLACDVKSRSSLAQGLMHAYIVDNAKLSRKSIRSNSGPITVAQDSDDQPPLSPSISRRWRFEDNAPAIVYKAKLWKLNREGNIKDVKDWYLRDMWIANNGSLCYFSQKDNKRLVLLDGHQMHDVSVERVSGGARGDHAFKLVANADMDQEKAVEAVFACDTAEELKEWMQQVEQCHERLGQTMHLGSNMASEFRALRLAVKNRRMKVSKDVQHKFSPVFKGKLWKLKADGDSLKDEDWFDRSMWLSANGSLVYYSLKEQKELVYFTAEDVAHAEINVVPDDKSSKPFAFQVRPSSADGIEFEPAVFAAQSDDMRKQWMAEFAGFSQQVVRT